LVATVMAHIIWVLIIDRKIEEISNNLFSNETRISDNFAECHGAIVAIFGYVSISANHN
jgi:hypothetical protein